MRKKSTAKDLVGLVAFGVVAWLAFQALFVGLAVLVGWLASMVIDVEWYVAALISYVFIRLVVVGIDAFGGLLPTRCPVCKCRIKTSRRVKCVRCGGPAQVAD